MGSRRHLMRLLHAWGTTRDANCALRVEKGWQMGVEKRGRVPLWAWAVRCVLTAAASDNFCQFSGANQALPDFVWSI